MRWLMRLIMKNIMRIRASLDSCYIANLDCIIFPHPTFGCVFFLVSSLYLVCPRIIALAIRHFYPQADLESGQLTA